MVIWKCLQSVPESLSCREERGEEDGEFIFLSHISKDRGVLQESQHVSQRERAADQRKLSVRLLLMERSCTEKLGS